MYMCTHQYLRSRGLWVTHEETLWAQRSPSRFSPFSSHMRSSSMTTIRAPGRGAFAKLWSRRKPKKRVPSVCDINDILLSRGGSKRSSQHHDLTSVSTALTMGSSTESLASGKACVDSIGVGSGRSILTDLICSQDWAYLSSFLRTREGIRAITGLELGTEPNPLHLVAYFGPPSGIIERLCQLRPEFASFPDQRGQVPLHIVCSRMRGEAQRGHSCMDTLVALLAADPSTVTLEDEEGMCPIEFAIVSNFQREEVRFLRKCSEIHHKKSHREKRERALKEWRTASQYDSSANAIVIGTQQPFSNRLMEHSGSNEIAINKNKVVAGSDATGRASSDWTQLNVGIQRIALNAAERKSFPATSA